MAGLEKNVREALERYVEEKLRKLEGVEDTAHYALRVGEVLR